MGPIRFAEPLVDEVDVARLVGRTRLAGECHGEVSSLEGLAGLADVVQQLNKTLLAHLRQRLGNGLPDDVAAPDETLICGIGEHKGVAGVAHHGEEGWRVFEDVRQARAIRRQQRRPCRALAFGGVVG